jgi:hypothetical protein
MQLEFSPQSLCFVFLYRKENAQLLPKFHIALHTSNAVTHPLPPNRPPSTNIHNINFKFSGQTQPPSLIQIPSYCSCPRTTFKITDGSPNCSPAALATGHLRSPYNLHFTAIYLLRKDQQTLFVIQSNIFLSFL